jgi:hypothetical protein
MDDLQLQLLIDLHKSNFRQGITTLNCSMDALPFDEGEFDVIWSEGAVYNMGFEAGVSAWSTRRSIPEAWGLQAHRFRDHLASRHKTGGAPIPLGD